MKTLCLIALMAVAAGTAARAQLNNSAPPELQHLTDIYAIGGADFDGIGRTVTYRDNVCVSNADIKLTCALLVADLPQSGGRLSHVVAETNVVIDAKDDEGHPIHATSDKTVYDYSVQNGVTNITVTLTGNPQPLVIARQGTSVVTNQADVIIWNRATKGFKFIGNIHSSYGPASAGTNAPPAATNELTATKMQQPSWADTNYPPGSLDLQPRPIRGGRGF
jgi:lipopolysaccharide export system protein LptA